MTSFVPSSFSSPQKLSDRLKQSGKNTLWEENLSQLTKHFPQAAQSTEISDISSILCQSVGDSAWRIGSGEPEKVQWLARDDAEIPALPTIREAFRKQIEQPKNRLFFLAGFGTGRFVSELLEDLGDRNEAIFVIEPDASLFRAALTLNDLRPVLGSGKVFFAVGDSSLLQAETIFRQHKLFVVQEFCLLFRESTLPPEQRQPYIQWLQTLDRVRKSIELEENRRIIDFRNQPRMVTSDNIRKVMIHERSPDALPHTRAQQHLARKFADAIRENGCEIIYPEFPSQTYYPPYAAVHPVVETDPDLIIVINSYSTDPFILGKNFANNLKRPKVDWFMDAPVVGYEHLKKTGLGQGEILASTDASWFDEVRDARPDLAERPVYSLPLAATYDEPGPIDEAWQCDVSYVGQVRDQSMLFNNPQLKPFVRKILDRIARAIVDGRGMRIEQLVQTSPLLEDLRQQYDLNIFLKTYYVEMIWEANSRYRVGTLQPLAKSGLRVYGNEDWAKLTKDTPLAKCFTGKTVAHEDLPRLFRNSRINVNMHHLQSTTSLNLRVFDVPAAGGFLLTDYMPGLEDHFEIDREIVVYRSQQELKDKVDYYLANPEQREEIARHGRERVMRDHTFRNRWHQLLDILRAEGWR